MPTLHICLAHILTWQLTTWLQALKWEVVPVITDFDPRFNNAKPMWFEKLYQPFLRGNLRIR